jgi:hypothetical protein
MNITSQYCDVCIRLWYGRGSEFQMKITENMQTHSFIETELRSPFEAKARAEAFASALFD